MSSVRVPKVQVFAIVRFDEFIDNGQDAVSVVEILPSPEEASREMERLNALNGAKGARYFVRTTRYYPEGRAGAVLESD